MTHHLPYRYVLKAVHDDQRVGEEHYLLSKHALQPTVVQPSLTSASEALPVVHPQIISSTPVYTVSLIAVASTFPHSHQFLQPKSSGYMFLIK